MIEPQGTPRASSSAIQCSAGRPAMTGAMIAVSAAAWRTRCGDVTKRSSAASSGRPSASEKRANWASLPTSSTIGRSDASKLPLGNVTGFELPMRTGTRPDAR